MDATDQAKNVANQRSKDGEPATPDRRKDRLIRIKSVLARTGLSVATVYRRESAGTFPKRLQIGVRSVAWYESDIEEFVANPMDYRQRLS
ncbi:helix-turn-helix transcriptional regulator [Sphingomonas tabacisoli]|uniref:Helix-turn-helix transcriptional regulator n=1 Tax=Sphingomonas tabacisoli TaxID=2249466 RepID=A0ABW4I2S7_9SPHN